MNESLPSLRRLFVVAVLLPAVVSLGSMIFINLAPAAFSRFWFYPWLTISIALLSWSAGRFLSPAWLCWIVFAWSLILLDLLTVAVCAGGRVEHDLGYVLVSAQIALVILWAILGAGRWQLRLPAAAAAAPAISALATLLGRTWQIDWRDVLMLSAGVMTVVCLGLRFFGFKFQPVRFGATSGNIANGPTVQFGVKHMLIWLTVTGPLLLVLRDIDVGDKATLAIVLLGLGVATVNLDAIWAVTGSGPIILRIIGLVAIPIAIATAFEAYSTQLNAAWKAPRVRLTNIEHAMMQMQGRWYTWFVLATAILAALLLFLRARGYRLMRRAQKNITTAEARV